MPYLDKKCREKIRSFHQCTDQHWCDRFAHVRCIREDFLNTKYLSIYQPVTVQLLVSAVLSINAQISIGATALHMYVVLGRTF